MPDGFKAPVRKPRGTQFLRTDPLTEAGEQDEPGAGNFRVGLDFPCQGQSVHARHIHIDDGQSIGISFSRRRPQAIKRIGAGGGLTIAHFPGNDLLVKESTAGPVVVDDQNPDVDQPPIAVRTRRESRRCFAAGQ